MAKIHVIAHRDELDQSLLADKVVVVLDVLFATSTIVTALAHGAHGVLPAGDETSARAAATRYPEGSYLLAGENRAIAIPGFGPFAPLALSREPLADKTVIYATTNGTVALKRAESAPHVYAGCLLNGAAVAERIDAHHGDTTVLLYCAGSRGRLALEDMVGAGHLIDRLLALRPDHWQLTDTALAARMLNSGAPVARSLAASRVGHMMDAMELGAEVAYSSRVDALRIVPKLVDGVLLPMVGE
jgi:2-phosphosulfolactate phosphatase